MCGDSTDLLCRSVAPGVRKARDIGEARVALRVNPWHGKERTGSAAGLGVALGLDGLAGFE